MSETATSVEMNVEWTVEVLLATYNGELYLREQIESVLAQQLPTGVALRVLARDDGSRDSTAQILAEYAAREPERFRVLDTDAPTGHAKWNFVRLLQAATAPYVCLCDQDDVWVPDKVARELAAMRSLEQARGADTQAHGAGMQAHGAGTQVHGAGTQVHGAGTPLLVFSDLLVVDAQLATTAESFWRQMGIAPASIHHLNRALVQDVVTGCTAMLNAPLRQLAGRMPAAAPMHDRWIALVAAALGHAAAVEAPLVLYRQHGGNVVGAETEDTSAGALLARTSDGSGRAAEWRTSQALAQAALAELGAELPAASARVLRAFVACGQAGSAVARCLRLARGGFWRHGLLRNAGLLATVARTKGEESAR